MAKTAFSQAKKAMAMAFFVATILLLSSQVANAMLNDGLQLNLGRRTLLAETTTGRSGYNEYPDGRGAYNENPTGRSGYNEKPDGRGGYNKKPNNENPTGRSGYNEKPDGRGGYNKKPNGRG
ncbi:translation initiation factor IF-2 [Jatropha curcas]|nr:translation initiation factor IF-2 [Jatropha curcas]